MTIGRRTSLVDDVGDVGADEAAGVGAAALADGAGLAGSVDGTAVALGSALGEASTLGTSALGEAAATWTVNVSWPRSMSPSSAEADTHLIRYSPLASARPPRVMSRGLVARPVPMLSPAGSNSRNELFEGSRSCENDRMIVVDRRGDGRAVGGIGVDQLGVREGPARDEDAQRKARQGADDAATEDRPKGGARPLAGSGQGRNTHECGV